MAKRRLDVVMTDRGLAPSRARAQSLILAGKVTVGGTVETKAGAQIDPAAEIVVALPDHPYVSRGALKLEAALDAFSISPLGLDCLDVGSSTGGFTDLLLRRGARRVIAVDVGRGQLDWSLRTDGRVTVMEGVNARYLDGIELPVSVALVTVDVSFISLRLVVPSLKAHMLPGAHLVCLVKPQFEAGRSDVGKGGIVRDESVRREAIGRTVRDIAASGFDLVGVVPSPIRGQKGNLEELAAFRLSPPISGSQTMDHCP